MNSSEGGNTVTEVARTKPRLTRNQMRSFWAAWGGWTMDGMDSFIYALVLVPALSELLPRSGIPATAANVGYYGGIFFAVFMAGYGCAMVWGPVADRFGRVRTMMISILWFSVFTMLTAFSTGVWDLAIYRFLAGVGIGGEWSVGSSLVAEDWPEERRTMGAGLMHTGYYFGFFLAALANFFVGSHLGWRYMFAVGVLPALMIGWIRRNVDEPDRWETRLDQLGKKWTMRDAFAMVFSPEYRRRTILNVIYLIVSLGGLWAGSAYVPSAVTFLAERAGRSSADAARLASYSSALLGIGTIIGALIVPFIADRLGRRLTMGIFYAMMLSFLVLAFGHVFYMKHNALPWFMVCTFLLGLAGANFVVYSFWLPEQYSTECRVSALAFTTNICRFAAGGFTFIVGIGMRHFGTIGTPIAIAAFTFLIGIVLLPFGVETKGQVLPG